MTALVVSDLVKRYRDGGALALDHVSLSVGEGEIHALVGANGAGKTTLLSILTTTLSPTSGRVRIAGLELSENPTAIRRVIGAVFQQSALDLNLTAEENLRLHAVLHGLHPWRPTFRLMPAAYRQTVTEMSALFGAEAALHRPVRTLSGGTRRKLEILRALMHAPQLLLLDEPSGGLDPEARRGLWEELHRIAPCQRTAVLCTTHHLEEAAAVHRVSVMDGGRLLLSGTPEILRGGNAAWRLESAAGRFDAGTPA
jgi:ABC-2 type transport system ATP-binding protein